MSLFLRAALYGLCLFLVMIVYTAQKHTSARATVAAAGKMTAKMYLWSAVAVVIMLALEYLFVD